MQNLTSGLLKPRLVEVVSKTPNHSRIVIEPLERGFGHSLGNALRRLRVFFMNILLLRVFKKMLLTFY
jgi:hypothetical protein